MKTWVFAALLGVLGLQAPATIQQANDGVIEVTVRNSVSKAPVPNARVRFVTFRTPPPNTITDMTADDNGRIVFKDLAPGTYSVDAQQEGFVRSLASAIVQNTLTITAAKKKIEYEALLVPGAIVRGRVLGPDGNPLPKAEVSMRSFTWVLGRRGITPTAIGTSGGVTDDRGEYSISALPAGEYLLRVELRPQSTGGQYSSTFDNLSRVTFYPGVPDGTVAAKINVTTGQEQGGLDIRIPSIPAYKISGTVLNTLPTPATPPNGRPLSRSPASFYIGSTDPNALEDPVLVPSRSEPTANPDEYAFEIGGMIPGSYYLYPLYNMGGLIGGYMSTRTMVVVKDQDIENLQLKVIPNPEIKGHATFKGDPSTMNLQNARISFQPVDRLPTLLRAAGLLGTPSVVDTKTGDFAISAFESGVKFTLSLTGFPPDSFIADVRQGGRTLNTDGIVIADPSQGALEITIDPQGGTVEGTVLKPTGEPQERAVIALVPTTLLRGNAMRYVRALGDQTTGKFTLRGVAPGEYKAFAWNGIPGTVAPQNAEFLAPIEAKGVTVIVSAGATQSIQLKALPNP